MFTETELEDLYAQGYSGYTAGNFTQASQLFASLVQASPFDERYWRGLASSEQMATNYKEALHAWAMVALLVTDDPMPHFHAAECLTSLSESDEALKALIMAENLLKSETREEISQQLQQKIQLLRETHGH